MRWSAFAAIYRRARDLGRVRLRRHPGVAARAPGRARDRQAATRQGRDWRPERGDTPARQRREGGEHDLPPQAEGIFSMEGSPGGDESSQEKPSFSSSACPPKFPCRKEQIQSMHRGLDYGNGRRSEDEEEDQPVTDHWISTRPSRPRRRTARRGS